ncbi:hypothetical protein BIV57_13360 [Mangrovactinospora gilvigrisea]|uniref:Uncharacterized protein n=1 Tax=Mangrovactinospora gilvigrisea TaxID=1428644 RepID=A0A1J7C658_9ACTN|nr:hypothetical protein BIV57_13360 [Mangrovactinospora gilvigrisea]
MSLLLAVTAIGLFAIIGLAVDGAGKAEAVDRAKSLAQEAARAGAQALDVPDAIADGSVQVDRDQAAAAARRYLTSAGVQGTVGIADGGRTLSVAVHDTYHPKLIGMLGINWQVSGQGRAELVYGIGGVRQ